MMNSVEATPADIGSIYTQENAEEKKHIKNIRTKKGVFKQESTNGAKKSNQASSKMYETNGENVETDSEDDDEEQYAISKIMDAVRMLKNETDLRPRITFLDFAGQNMYYAFHQIYISPKSCTILVVDMTKNLHEKVDVTDTDEKCCSQFESWTYKGNIH